MTGARLTPAAERSALPVERRFVQRVLNPRPGRYAVVLTGCRDLAHRSVQQAAQKSNTHRASVLSVFTVVDEGALSVVG